MESDLGCRKSFQLTSVRGKEVTPLFFIMVVSLISRKISIKDVLRKGMYANDLAMIADKKQELQELLENGRGWSRARTDNEPEKTEEMWV